MAGITLDRVTKAFGAVKAVDGVSLEVGDGEFLVLVGPSGCGKSTLLRLLAGLEDVTDGTIAIGDRDVTDLAPRSRDIAMVFQSYALYPHMTVRQNLGYGLRARKTPKDEIARRVGEVAELLGLADLLERRPAQLSGGQRQRVAMGRAIVRQPQAFLLDEPLSNLDAKLRVGMRASLAQLHQRLGVTTVYVTHDQTEAMTLGQRVAVMRDGHILQCDSPSELYARPNDLFIAAFIGSPAMNLVEAFPDGDTIRFGQFSAARAAGAAARPRRPRHPARGVLARQSGPADDRRARRGGRGPGLRDARVLPRRRASRSPRRRWNRLQKQGFLSRRRGALHCPGRCRRAGLASARPWRSASTPPASTTSTPTPARGSPASRWRRSPGRNREQADGRRASACSS